MALTQEEMNALAMVIVNRLEQYDALREATRRGLELVLNSMRVDPGKGVRSSGPVMAGDYFVTVEVSEAIFRADLPRARR